jgi:hypothetical protein
MNYPIPISTLCRVRQHEQCKASLERGTVKSCGCYCHKLDELATKPPTIDFDHRVKGREDTLSFY